MSAFLLTFLLALAISAASARADDGTKLRADAVVVFKAFWNATGYLIACPKYVGETPPYLDAAEEWKQRHDPYLARMTAVFKRYGDLSATEKDRIAGEALQNAEISLEQRGDSGAYCFSLDDELRSGAFDFDKMDEVAPALERLMKASLG